jgi:enamine deaminase RidA (YjgF/YER057c/UK114 family)
MCQQHVRKLEGGCQKRWRSHGEYRQAEYRRTSGHLPIVRGIRDKYVNTAAPPASIMLEIQKLAREGALIDVEAIAVLPAK